MLLPTIAITAGEPAGIGPDLCIMLAQRTLAANVVVIADTAMLQARAAQLQLPLNIIPYAKKNNQAPSFSFPNTIKKNFR